MVKFFYKICGETTMKFQIMIGILFTLLTRRKTTSAELAAMFNCSVRSVYRYLDELTVAGIPIDVTRGAGGGVSIPDTFKLPKGFFTREEFARTVEAMQAMLAQTGDAALQNALDKICAQLKTEKFDQAVSGNILVDGGGWSDARFSERLAYFERAVEEHSELEIDYSDRTGERSKRRIHPHLLVYKQNIWYVFAYCTKREAFRLFKLGRVRSATETGERFERRPFERKDIPLSFWNTGENVVEAKFEISEERLPFAEEWLGIERVYSADGKFFAEVSLPDDDSLVGKILSAGAGIRVLSPASLAERVKREALLIAGL